MHKGLFETERNLRSQNAISAASWSPHTMPVRLKAKHSLEEDTGGCSTVVRLAVCFTGPF